MSERQVFLFARHGETAWNAEGRWQGQTDIPLNDRGRAQAKALGLRLRNEGIGAVASSDLSRARETAEIAGGELGLAVSYTEPAFRERAYGIFEGLTREECLARYPVEWARYERDPSELPSSVEAIEHVAARMLLGLQRVSARGGATWLVVSHGRAIRALASLVTDAATTPLANGGVYRIVVERGEPVSAALLPEAG